MYTQVILLYVDPMNHMPIQVGACIVNVFLAPFQVHPSHAQLMEMPPPSPQLMGTKHPGVVHLRTLLTAFKTLPN